MEGARSSRVGAGSAPYRGTKWEGFHPAHRRGSDGEQRTTGGNAKLPLGTVGHTRGGLLGLSGPGLRGARRSASDAQASAGPNAVTTHPNGNRPRGAPLPSLSPQTLRAGRGRAADAPSGAGASIGTTAPPWRSLSPAHSPVAISSQRRRPGRSRAGLEPLPSVVPLTSPARPECITRLAPEEEGRPELARAPQENEAECGERGALRRPLGRLPRRRRPEDRSRGRRRRRRG